MKTKLKFLPLLIVLTVVFMSIGYSAFNRELLVNEIGATIRITSDIRISGVSIENTTNNGISSSENYNINSILSDIKLPNENSTITFKVNVTNFGNANMGIYSITGLPNNLDYELSDYTLKSKICDTNNNCNLGITKTFYITIKYAQNGYDENNIDYNINLDFKFKKVYTINYVLNDGINPEKQKTSYMEGEEVNILSPTKENAIFDGWYETEDFSGNKITTITNRDNDITLFAKWKYKIFFQLPPDWQGSNVYVYLYNDNTNNGWPGYSTTLEDNDKLIYSYTLSTNDIQNYDSVIFVNENSSSRQTIDLSFNSDILSKIFVPELYSSTDEIRVLFSGSSNWSPYLYLWKGNTNNSWPGEIMNNKISGSGYSATIDINKYNMMIFNKGYGGTNNQSSDLNVPTHQDLTYDLSNGPYRFYYLGSWHDYNNWINSEYDNWKKNDYVKFQEAQNYFNY